jgi:hypothetical protein
MTSLSIIVHVAIPMHFQFPSFISIHSAIPTEQSLLHRV